MSNGLQLNDLSEDDKRLLLEWAEKVKALQKNKTLTKKQKVKAFSQLNNSNAFKSCSKLAMSYSKEYWKNASYAERLGIIGGIAFVGLGGAGVSALGGAVGIPFFLLTAAGGPLLIGLKSEIIFKQYSSQIKSYW
ncbi:hypothetical protein [Cellulophaga baltica]|uniref:hypothetical protein n=1 Tax=Cellulophaga baltica TaxID=76594 RepID=UPI0015F38A0F|nr:hypothetical protein [Cellulophaga baltica]MBA6316877.1 hypothetical protein [Cellulophaga baltica]